MAIGKGHLKCVKHLLQSSWIENNLDMKELINSQSIKNAIEQDQLEILAFFISHPKRFTYIIDLLIDYHGDYFNLVSMRMI